MIVRRTFLGAVAGGLFVARTGAAQEPGNVYRIGYLSTPTRASVEKGVQAFLQALRELGWVDGRNFVIEFRWAEGDVERLPALASELCKFWKRRIRSAR